MSTARFILVALICASPVMLLWDGLDTGGILGGFVAVAVAITALALPPRETEFLISVGWLTAALAVLPGVWIVFQVIPLRPLAHPIWASAQSALGHPITGEISIDPGASIIGLGKYLVLCGVAFVAAAVSIDRRRAESLLFALLAAAAVIALFIISHDLLFADFHPSPLLRKEANDCAAIGAIIASAACIRTIERYKTRHDSSQRTISVLFWTFVACGLALMICVAALLIDATREVLVATASGLAAIICITVVRRFRLRNWGLFAFAVSLIGLAIIFSMSQVRQGNSLLLAFGTSSSAFPSDISERVLKDAPLVGTGARSFAAVAQIYREIDDPPPHAAASTAAATFAIELGRPMLGLIVAATVACFFIFLKASVERGRDSFYPAMGGASVLTLLLLSFINAGLMGTATALIGAVVLGIAIAQSKSRTVQA